eukprot:gene1393-2681_t
MFVNCTAFRVLHQANKPLRHINSISEDKSKGYSDLPKNIMKAMLPLISASSILLSNPLIGSASDQLGILQTDSISLTMPTVSLQTAETQLIQLFDQSTSSVVNINTFISQINAYSMNIMEVPQGTGSGFIWDNQGHIVTNYHVIRNANAAKVTLLTSDGKSKTYAASVQGVDPDKDIAVLTIDIQDPVVKQSLRPISVGSSFALRVGQAVLAIGNPFGLDHTLTTGIISGLGREVRSPSNRPINNVIQTDAAINPGNSGGPLLDSAGRLIGMNTAIYSPSGGSAGIGFAIPVDTLKYVVDTLIREGKVVRPAIGISYLEGSQARVLGIDKGVLVLDVPPGTPGSKAGMKGTTSSSYGGISLGDIIIGIDDNEISSEADLFKALEKYKVGDTITITVLRTDPKGEGINGSGSGGGGVNKFKTNELKLRLQLEAKAQFE